MQFQVGDVVRYELSWWGKPRWVGNRDRGGSGHWEEGVVVDVGDCEIVVEGRTGRSVWPLVGHRHFCAHQWEWSGYLTVVSAQPPRNEKKCVCGAHAVYGVGCGTHSHWCDLAA